jgi:GNAT superfamily N-acetyltransferase
MLADLGARAFAGAFAADNTPEDMEAYLREHFSTEALAAEIADPRAVFLVAEADGAPAGYSKLLAGAEAPECVSGRRPVELVRLYALQEFLGAGVGEKTFVLGSDAQTDRVMARTL